MLLGPSLAPPGTLLRQLRAILRPEEPIGSEKAIPKANYTFCPYFGSPRGGGSLGGSVAAWS
eukprot:8715-Pyramimonas_sp.AAC.1